MKSILISLVLLVASMTTYGQVTRAPLKLGDKAPDFALPNGDGKVVKLSDYTARGPVVLIFYRGYW